MSSRQFSRPSVRLKPETLGALLADRIFVYEFISDVQRGGRVTDFKSRKWDKSHEVDEYYDLLIEMEMCVWRVMEIESQTEFTDEEIMAKIIYTVGTLKMAAQAQRLENFGLEEAIEYHDDFVEKTGRDSYRYMLWAIEFCESTDD